MKRVIIIFSIMLFAIAAVAQDVSIDENGNVTTGINSAGGGNLEVIGSSGQDGIRGSANGTNAAGVYGENTSDGVGVYGSSESGNAGYFDGNAEVTGNLTVGGTITGNGLGDITEVKAGAGLIGGGDSGNVSLNVDTTLIQNRVTGVCASGFSISTINEDGTVLCEADDGITIENDPEVGTILLNTVPKWDGSSLVTGSISDNGNVGIGIAPQAAKLHVNGDFNVTAGNIELRREDQDAYIQLVSDDASEGTTMRIKSLDAVGFAVTDGNDNNRLVVPYTGGIFVEGPSGTGNATLPITGAGTRLMWYPEKASFRAGMVFGSQWDDANIGGNSTAMGMDIIASGMGSTAFGINSTASGNFSSVLGSAAIASGDYSTAMGTGTWAESGHETVLGAYNSDYTPTSIKYWFPGDRLFVIGNGAGPIDRSDAMVVLKNGNTSINGDLTATAFFGNGSGLTNVSVSSVDWTYIANVPADLADGDNVDDADNDKYNELQSLGLIGNTLSISDSNSVDLTAIGSDTLATLNCTHHQIAKFKAGIGWVCFDDPTPDLESRIAQLETLLAGTTRTSNDITFSGVNVHVNNGAGTTSGAGNGLGNLIVGYNELRGSGDDRTGSHNIVVGANQNYSSFGGIVSGYQNTISNMYASVIGGQGNAASGAYAVVSGGQYNTASSTASSVTGGQQNSASGGASSVTGGYSNQTTHPYANVSGGSNNTAGDFYTQVIGGQNNTAVDPYQVVGHQIPDGYITSAMIADGSIVNSDVSITGGLYASKDSLYENQSDVLLQAGNCATVSSSCNDSNDLPIAGSCSPPGISASYLRATYMRRWNDPTQAAETRCTICNDGTAPETISSHIQCVDVP